VAVRDETELAREIESLRAELASRQRESADRERQLERYAADLRETYKQERGRSRELVRALSNAVEARDAYTSKHAERVTAYALEIARALGIALSDSTDIEFGFLLHDIGKVAISDAILHKPGPLTDDEREQMREHPLKGEEIVRGIEFLRPAAEVIRSHHERWDGRGYPDGLRGEEIPLTARVFAVADVFDAMTSERPYRPVSSLADARALITDEAGRQFDPQVVEAFNSIPDGLIEQIRAEIR
jgi:putative nucleotidyltransferase with HDIG domain